MSSRQFDPKRDFRKLCRYGKSAQYEQDGSLFDAGHKYIGKAKDPTDTPEKRAEDNTSVKARAAEKIGNLKGFTSGEKPDAIQQAESENSAARAAEEHVQ